MIKRIAIWGILGLLLLGVGTAWAQRDSDRGPGAGPMMDNARIVKGTIDRVGDDYIAIAVEDIFVPGEGPMEEPPKTVRIAVGDKSRFVTEEGRDSALSNFSKGDSVVAITEYEDGKYSLRALVSSDVAAAMRKRIGERVKERRDRMEPGMEGPGGRFGGQRGQGMLGQRQMPLLVGTFDGYGKDGVTLTLTGVLQPSGEDEPNIQRLPEEKTVTVRIFDRTRFFHDGKRASIDDFTKGESIIALIPRRGAGQDEGPVLMLLTDKVSAEKLRDLMRGMRENQGDRERARDNSGTW